MTKLRPLPDTRCLTHDEIMCYLQDDCLPADVRAIDRHLLHCPMCSDAVEGLMSVGDSAVLVHTMTERLSAKIADQIVSKPPVLRVLEVVKRPFWRREWVAAAGILLLIGGSLWLYRTAQSVDNTPITLNNNTSIVESDTILFPNTPVEGDKPLETTRAPQYTEGGKGDMVSTMPSNAPMPTEFPPSPTLDVEKKLPVSPPAPASEVMASVSEKPTTAYPTTDGSSRVVDGAQYDKTEAYSGASAQNSVPRPSSSSPVQGRKKESSPSNKTTDNVVNTEAATAKTKTPSVSDALLASAARYVEEKRYAEAITAYNQYLSREKTGDNVDKAMFQLAQVYLLNGNKAEAKRLFEEISRGNGQYIRAAKKILKDLN